MLFLQLLPYVSVFCDACPCIPQIRKSFSFRATENLGREIYKDTVHLVLYLRHFQPILLFPFSRSLTQKRKEHKLLMEDNRSFFFFKSSPLGSDQWSYTRDELYPKQVFLHSTLY